MKKKKNTGNNRKKYLILSLIFVSLLLLVVAKQKTIFPLAEEVQAAECKPGDDAVYHTTYTCVRKLGPHTITFNVTSPKYLFDTPLDPNDAAKLNGINEGNANSIASYVMGRIGDPEAYAKRENKEAYVSGLVTEARKNSGLLEPAIPDKAELDKKKSDLITLIRGLPYDRYVNLAQNKYCRLSPKEKKDVVDFVDSVKDYVNGKDLNIDNFVSNTIPEIQKLLKTLTSFNCAINADESEKKIAAIQAAYKDYKDCLARMQLPPQVIMPEGNNSLSSNTIPGQCTRDALIKKNENFQLAYEALKDLSDLVSQRNNQNLLAALATAKNDFNNKINQAVQECKRSLSNSSDLVGSVF